MNSWIALNDGMYMYFFITWTCVPYSYEWSLTNHTIADTWKLKGAVEPILSVVYIKQVDAL